MTHGMNFRLASVGHVCETMLGKMLQTAPRDSEDQEVPYLRAGSLGSLSDTSELPTMFAGIKEIEDYSVRAGDLLVAEGGDVGRAEFLPKPIGRTILQNSLHRVRLRSEGDLRFVRYALISIHGSGYLDVLCNRTTFGHLTVEKFRDLRIPWPSPHEQRRIADYLDIETARIDSLISVKRRLIELCTIRTRCQAITMITENGPPAPLRRFISRVKTGTTPPERELPELLGGDVAWFSPGDMGPYLEMRDPARTLSGKAIVDGWSPLFPADTTLIIGIGATAGRVGHNTQESTGNQQITCISSNKRVLPRFLSWQLWARSDEIREIAPYTTLPILNNEFLRSLPFYAPSLETQQNIVETLDELAGRETQVSQLIWSQIELLKERRQSLITATVTGELSVPVVQK